MARNHQWMGVNKAVASVKRQGELQEAFPPGERLITTEVKGEDGKLELIEEKAHKELGQLGVFWHTQGSGKSYSMLMFAEKVRPREVFSRFNAVLTEPASHAYAERRDNLETIYNKLTQERDLADVHSTLRELHRVVNLAIDTRAQVATEHPEARVYDLSAIDLEKLRDEFAKTKRKNTAVQEIREVVEKRLAQMLAANPLCMDFNQKYQEIIAEYNRDKDRVTTERTFAALVDLVGSMNEEEQRAAEEGLEEDELAIFDLLKKETLKKTERERVKQASRDLLQELRRMMHGIDSWTDKETTRAEVETTILDHVYENLPDAEYPDAEKRQVALTIFNHIWQRSGSIG